MVMSQQNRSVFATATAPWVGIVRLVFAGAKPVPLFRSMRECLSIPVWLTEAQPMPRLPMRKAMQVPRMQALLPPAPHPAPEPQPKWPAPAHDGLAGRFGLGLGLGVAS